MTFRAFRCCIVFLCRLLWVCFCAAGTLLMTQANAEAPTFKPRWFGDFHLSVPEDWRMVVDGRSVGYYTGIHPLYGPVGPLRELSEEALMALPSGAVMWGAEPPPRRHAEHGYRGFVMELAEGFETDAVRHVEISEEDIVFAGVPALKLVVRAVGAVEPGSDQLLTMIMGAVIETMPQTDGTYRMLNVMLSEALDDRMPDLIDRIVASLDMDTPPPFEPERPFSYGGGAFRAGFTRPVFAADGFAAIGHIANNTLQVFDAGGYPHAEWDLSAHFPEEDVGRLWHLDLDFTPDGAIAVLFSYYKRSMRPEILIFERDGTLRERLVLELPEVRQDDRFVPRELRVGYEGQYILVGSPASEVSRGEVHIDTVSAEGAYRSRRSPGFNSAYEGVSVAALPGDRLALLRSRDGAHDPRGRLVVIEADGKISREWGPYGHTFAERGLEHSPEFFSIAGSDRSGRVYTTMDDEFHVFDADGSLLESLPLWSFPFRRFDGMAVSPLGHVLAAVRPQHMSRMDDATLAVLQPSLIVMRYRDALPDASPLQPSSVAPSPQPVVAMPAATFDRQLVELAANERLTVRALRAFGALPDEAEAVDALALHMRRHGLDLFGADAGRIARWSDGEEGRVLDEAQRVQLQRLHQRLVEVREVATRQRDRGGAVQEE